MIKMCENGVFSIGILLQTPIIFDLTQPKHFGACPDRDIYL